MRRLGLSLVLLSAALLLQPTGAQAQVVVDPDSPAGKEYAIPLEEKREQTSGDRDARSGDGQAATFGEGISDPTKDDGAGSGAKRSKKKSGKKDSKADDNKYDTTAVGGGGSSGGGGGGPDEAGTSGALLTSGIALAVLLLGGGIAFLMRRGAFGTDA